MINERKIVNKVLLFGWHCVIVLLLIAYLLEVIIGERNIQYWLAILVIGMIPVIMANILYFKDKENQKIKYIAAYGYSVLYIFLLITAETVLVCIYIIPILSAILIFHDYKLIRNFAIINILANVFSVVNSIFILNDTSADNIADREIQLAGLTVTLILAYTICRYSIKINDSKMSVIKNQKDEQEKLLKELIGFTNYIYQTTEKIYSEARLMAERADSTVYAIAEISEGAMQNVVSIQQQLEMTNDIQKTIVQTVTLSEEINKLVVLSEEKISRGMDNMKALNISAQSAKESNEEVQVNMDELNKKAEEAKGIINIIGDIAGQTNLLALNASIEAARAGEAGRGFAIVASEITKLANQTKDATESIGTIVNKLKQDASSASEAVEVMTKAANKQNKIIFETEENFKAIQNNVSQVAQNILTQSNKIDELQNSNKVIIESINAISSFSEEVTANTDSTKGLIEKNMETTEQVKELLKETTNELRDFQKEHLQK